MAWIQKFRLAPGLRTWHGASAATPSVIHDERRHRCYSSGWRNAVGLKKVVVISQCDVHAQPNTRACAKKWNHNAGVHQPDWIVLFFARLAVLVVVVVEREIGVRVMGRLEIGQASRWHPEATHDWKMRGDRQNGCLLLICTTLPSIMSFEISARKQS